VTARDARGRVAVVTGGATGIGQVFAERLAEDGHRVVVADLSPADDTIALVEKAGSEGLALRCDISSPESVTEFAAQVHEAYGRVDVLVNNAGIYPATLFADMDFAEWRKVMSVNLDSIFLFGKAFVPGMIERGWGRVVSISSTTFHSGIAYNTHYTASKGGVIGFTRALASEVGAGGVTVNSIAPGLVRTDTTAHGPQSAWFDSLAEQQAIKRTEEPGDLAGALSFLASDDAAFITGQTLVVDGGWMRA
jgi:NAD(P)-dependent dehydrogenase (short-subunit alcohol dehydrogenase family)